MLLRNSRTSSEDISHIFEIQRDLKRGAVKRTTKSLSKDLPYTLIVFISFRLTFLASV